MLIIFFLSAGGNNSLRFPIFIENIINEVIFELINKREKFNAKDIHIIIKKGYIKDDTTLSLQ